MAAMVFMLRKDFSKSTAQYHCDKYASSSNFDVIPDFFVFLKWHFYIFYSTGLKFSFKITKAKRLEQWLT